MADHDGQRPGTGLQRFGLARDRLNIGLSRTIGLSRSDLHALEHLEAEGRLTPTQLADRLGLTTGGTTTLIDRLESAGWVVRTRNADDRRSLLIELSASAAARGRSIVGAYERDVDAQIRKLSARDLAMVNRGSGLQRFGLARDRLNIGLCRTVGLSQSDFHALEHLEASGGLTPTQLAERLGLTSGGVTTLVDRLEQAGWVVRAPNPRDRRSLVVELSGSAKARGRSIVGAYERDVEDAIHGLSKRDLAIVNRVLETVAEIADAHADELWRALRDRS